MTKNLGDEFRQQAETAMALYADLRHEWRTEPGATRLRFPNADPNGFPVEVVADEDSIHVFALGAHELFDLREHTPEHAATAALGLVRDLLSPDMRVREWTAGSRPYKWVIEARRDGEWHPEGQTALLFYNYFATRQHRVYRNRQLPGRLAAAG